MDVQQNGLALLIEGTPSLSGGFVPLITIGTFPSEGIMNIADGFVQEPVSYSVCHTANDICYTLTDRAVRPYGSQQKGILRINIAINRQKQLADRQSPYTILKEVYNTFVALNMWAAPGGSHIFNEGEFDSSIFKSLLNKYRLEPTTLTYVMMDPEGSTAVIHINNEEELSELMRDSQYAEFSKVKRVEMGSMCASTINIRIPRVHNYRVFLNGRNTRVTLSEAMDTFNSADLLADTEYQTWDHVRFRLEELQASPNGRLFSDRVRLDKGGERIECIVSPVDKKFEFSTAIKRAIGTSAEAVEKTRQLLQNGRLKISLGKEDITTAFVSDEALIVTGSNVEKLPQLSIKENDEMEFSIEADPDKKQYCLRVRAKKIHSAVPAIKESHTTRRTESSYPISATTSNVNLAHTDKHKFQITILVEDPTRQYKIIIRSKDKRFYMRQDIDFTKEGQEYKAKVALDEAWAGVGMLEVVLQRLSSKGTIEQSQPIQACHESTRAYNIHVDSLIFKPTFSSLKWLKPLNVAIILIVVSFATGFIGYKIGIDNVQIRQHDQIAEKHTDSEYSKHIEILTDSLKIKDAQIVALQSQLSVQSKSTVPAKAATTEAKTESVSAKDEIARATRDYRKEIIDAVNMQDWLTVNDLLYPAHKAGQITKYQRAAITSYYWDVKADRQRNAAEMKRIGIFLKGRKFKSIDEIAAFSKKISHM